jgi:large subunit ribosomal protein L15
MSLLNKVKKITTQKKKRLGRGYGSGKGGHTTNRGMKGQKSRVGSKIPLWFEGGQLPLIKRIPMLRGKGRFKQVRPIAEITFSDINKFDFDVVSLETLKANRIIDPRFEQAKIIKSGKLKKKITVKGIKVSAGAVQVIKDLGGTIEPAEPASSTNS